MLTLYARRERTTDDLALRHGLGPKMSSPPAGKTQQQLISMGYFGKLDVVLYHDQACTYLAARHPWYFSTKPTRRSKTVMHNCFRYLLVWLSDKLETQGLTMPAPRSGAA
jgi:hypothetical protein